MAVNLLAFGLRKSGVPSLAEGGLASAVHAGSAGGHKAVQTATTDARRALVPQLWLWVGTKARADDMQTDYTRGTGILHSELHVFEIVTPFAALWLGAVKCHGRLRASTQYACCIDVTSHEKEIRSQDRQHQCTSAICRRDSQL